MDSPRPQHISMGSVGQPGGMGLGGGNDRQPVGAIAVIAVVAFLLQVVIAPNIAIAGISPNFLMIALVPISLMSSQRTSVIAGFILGLLFDLLGAGPVGGMALVLAVMGYVLPLVTGAVQANSFSAWVIIMALAALLGGLAYCIVISILGYETSFFASIWFKVLPWTVYNIIIGAIVWPILRRVQGTARPTMESRIKL